MKKLGEFWKSIPEFVKVGLWIGFSAGATAILTSCLDKPELFPYYGLLNFALFALKELDKKYRRAK